MTATKYVLDYFISLGYLALAAGWLIFLSKKFPRGFYGISIWAITFFMPSIIFVVANIKATR